MLPKRFLFHTMSAVTLFFALTMAGYAADSTNQQSIPESSSAQEFVSSAVYGQAENAQPDKTNVDIVAEVDNTPVDTDNTVKDTATATETNGTEAPETHKEASVPEDTPPTVTTDAVETNRTSSAPLQGHAPVVNKTGEASSLQPEQASPSAEKPLGTEEKPSTSMKEQLPVPAAPVYGHAPVKENVLPSENNLPTVQDSTPKITIVDPVAVPVQKEAPVKGVAASNYVVKKGDTLFIIAKNHGTSVSAIKSSNGLKSDALYVGQRLAIPSNTTSATTYKVKNGDTLYLLSRRYGTTVSTIKSTNGLKSDALYVGQILKMPSNSAANNTSSGYASVTVKEGDTLYLLSKRYGTTVSAIKSTNGLISNTLTVGKVLKIPSGTTQASAASRQTSTASRSQASRSEVLLLARLIYGESRGETYEGQVAVGAVVLNRVKSSIFPDTIAGVIYQKNEFSVVLDGQINLTPDATAIKAAEAALSGYDPTGGALFYWNPVKAPNNKFLNAKPIIARIGSHVFAK